MSIIWCLKTVLIWEGEKRTGGALCHYRGPVRLHSRESQQVRVLRTIYEIKKQLWSGHSIFQTSTFILRWTILSIRWTLITLQSFILTTGCRGVLSSHYWWSGPAYSPSTTPPSTPSSQDMLTRTEHQECLSGGALIHRKKIPSNEKRSLQSEIFYTKCEVNLN